jgi:hypothetical protein
MRKPPTGAGELKVIVPVEPIVAMTGLGLAVIEAKVAEVTESVAFALELPREAVMRLV